MAEGKRPMGAGLLAEMEEVEAAVRLVESGEFDEIAKAMNGASIAEKLARHPVSNDMDLAAALLDPNVLPGPATTQLIRERAHAVRAAQTSAKTFLSRPYHEHNANRFLFSCADESDGYAQNPTTGWRYTLPEQPAQTDKKESSAGSSSRG
jgi:hypothetical protein